jgi:uncharacterized coiled-coil protein SlyX
VVVTPIELERRVVDLELRLMSLERDFQVLSDIVTTQQRVIEALRLEANHRARASDAEPSAGNERPPHY